MKKIIVIAALFFVSFGAAAQEQQPQQTVRTQSVMGGIGGLAAGAALGQMVGGGRGRILGALVGAVAGGFTGAHLFGSDTPVQNVPQAQPVYSVPNQANANYAGGIRTTYVIPDNNNMGPCDGETKIDGEYNPPAAKQLCLGKMKRARQQQRAYEQAAYMRGLSGADEE